MARLNEKLKNTEDKLSAAENTKLLMQSEIKTYEELKEQLSSDLEVIHHDNYRYSKIFSSLIYSGIIIIHPDIESDEI